MDPKTPLLRAKIEICKPNAPIRPIVKNTQAPSYKLAKIIDLIPPKSELSIIKSMKLAHDINEIKLCPEHKFLMLHIQDLYILFQ
jgi:hypothetical protein